MIVRPNIRPPITYYGGKQSLAKYINDILPEHFIFVEAFFGGGALTFFKEPSPVEVVNDADYRVTNFFWVLQDKVLFEELYHKVQLTMHSEPEYIKSHEILKLSRKDMCPNVDLAWAFWVHTNMGFGGSLESGWKFCNSSDGTGGHIGKTTRNKRMAFTHRIHKRFESIQICSRDALRVIKDRDSEETVFYLDPPYPGYDQGHYEGYTHRDLQKIDDCL